MNNTNNEEYVTRLKKAYSTLSQATNQIIFEEGTPKATVGGWATSVEEIYKHYKKHLLNARDCGTSSGCFGQGIIKTLKGTNDADYDNYTTSPKLVLADGTQVMFFASDYFSQSCEATYAGLATHVCANIYVDVNGRRKPNTYGRDVFVFALKENGLHPIGCETSIDNCNKSSIGNGCACKVLREGAMNY